MARVGDRIELVVGPPAHGGHCVARYGQVVVFVRHALPGERVVGEVTEVRRGHLRADAVEVLTAAADRVAPPCPYARPGACGGCDLQHATAPAQREWKAAVVREQLRRLGGLSDSEVAALGVRVTELPGGLLDWRTRVRYTVDVDGRAGLLAHRSHQVVPIDRCRIAHPRIQELDVTARSWPQASAVTVVTGVAGDVSIRADGAPVAGPRRVRQWAAGREWALPPEVFWQVHPAAADTLANAVLELLDPRPGEHAWDLYGGAGLFAAVLADRGADVTLVESSAPAVAVAREQLPGVRIVHARVEAALRRTDGPPPRPGRGGRGRGRRRPLLPARVDLVVLDPPRAGAGAAVVRGITAAAPRAVAYVACDPAAFARDVRTFREAGWSLTALRGYDCFPMTHHVELVGQLVPERGHQRRA